MNYNNQFRHDDFYKAIYFPDYEPRRTKNIISRVFLALCVYTLLSYAVVFLAELFVILKFGRENARTILESPYYIFAIQILSMYIIALPVFLLICRTGITKLTQERAAKLINQKAHSFMSVEEFVVCFFISTALMILGGLVSNAFTGVLSGVLGHTIENSTAELIEKTPIWLVILVAVIIGPIFEEFIFRKTMIDILGEFGRSYAIFVSAISFGLFHGNFSQVLYASLLGFVLGYVYVKTGKLIYTIIFHCAINLFTGVFAAYATSGPAVEEFLKIIEDETLIYDYEKLATLIEPYALQLIPYLIYSYVLMGLSIAGFVIFFILTLRRKITLEQGILPPENNHTFSNFFLTTGVASAVAFVAFKFIFSIII